MGEFDTVMQTRDEVEDYITIKNSLNPSRGVEDNVLVLRKRCLPKYGFFLLKLSA